MTARVSVVVPVYNEGAVVVSFLDRLFEAVALPCEVLAVYDTPEDTTLPFLVDYARREPRLRPTHNAYGRGPASALRFGIDQAAA
ncbi:MAG: glycosyltransferase, partial [Candidatus Dormibacteraeota bacterium]|nr:glycosyltransferase [Candidatus Dormibacteraeota bacterium]